MRVSIIAALLLMIQVSPLHAEPDWGLLEDGATLLGKARSWVQNCESEQLDRLDGLISNLNNVLVDAGLTDADLFRFKSILESSEQLESGVDGSVDCSNEAPRKEVGPAMGMITEAITP